MLLPSYETAKVHLALGDHNAALRWLERAFEERSHSMHFFESILSSRPCGPILGSFGWSAA